jgi:acyl-CoA thioester hydrolase
MKASINYRIPYADTDQMGVVYYANYLVYFERVRNELFRDSGIRYKDLESQGIMLPVIEAHCNYSKPAKYDDLITIKGQFTQLKGTRIKIDCSILLQEEEIARGYTIHAFMNAETKRPTRPPKEITKILQKE